MAEPPFSGKGRSPKISDQVQGQDSGTAQNMCRTVTKCGALSCVVGLFPVIS